MIFPELGSGPTYEIDEFWEDMPPFSPEFYEEMRRLAEKAVRLCAALEDFIC